MAVFHYKLAKLPDAKLIVFNPDKIFNLVSQRTSLVHDPVQIFLSHFRSSWQNPQVFCFFASDQCKIIIFVQVQNPVIRIKEKEEGYPECSGVLVVRPVGLGFCLVVFSIFVTRVQNPDRSVILECIVGLCPYQASFKTVVKTCYLVPVSQVTVQVQVQFLYSVINGYVSILIRLSKHCRSIKCVWFSWKYKINHEDMYFLFVRTRWWIRELCLILYCGTRET